MPNENTKTSNDTLPNGRNKAEFEKECQEFLETYYPSLLNKALFLTQYDPDKAHDLMHDTIVVLMKGGDRIDFALNPQVYFYHMLKRERERNRRLRQRRFELFENRMTRYDEHWESDLRISNDIEDTNQCKEWQQSEREGTSFQDLADVFPQFMSVLTPRERTYITWQLEGLTYGDIQKKHAVTKARIGQIFTSARKKLKKAAEDHLQAAE